MSNLNLSEAAAEILQKSLSDAKGKEDKMGSTGYVPKVKAPQQGEIDISGSHHKTTDAALPDPTKGMGKQATLPTGSGVAPEPMHKLSGQPQQTQGRSDLTASPEKVNKTFVDDNVEPEKKSKLHAPVSKSNPGAVKPYVPEGTEGDEDEEGLEEASYDEVLSDLESLSEEEFEEKYGIEKEAAVVYLESLGDDEEEEEDSAAIKEARTEEMKAKMKEDIDAMLSGETLSEEFKTKASTIFEAAVEARVEDIAKELEERYLGEFENAVEQVKEDFAAKLDSYLDYVVENWMVENEIAIEKGLRTEIVEDFIEGFKNLCAEHYIDIPEDKVDIVEQLVDKVEDLETQVNEQILKNIELKQTISEHKKEEAVLEVCEGLSLSQVEKIKSIAKNVEFVTEEDFNEKLVSIKESYFPNGIVSTIQESLEEAIDLEDEGTSTKAVDPLIEQYAHKISKYKF
jgi:AcrR family transcriptional regulator